MINNTRIFTKFYRHICAATIIFSIICTDANAQQTSTRQNCNNSQYRTQNPDKCKFFLNNTTILGASAALGGAAVLLGLSGSGSSGSSNSAAPTSPAPVIQPTIATKYNMVGADVDQVRLANVTQSATYTKNINQYNDIRAAYSLARGYTGVGTNIAILDSAPTYWHGNAVADIAANSIAPNANVTSYTVSYGATRFMSFYDIGDIIASANNAHIYNASWSVQTPASVVKSRQYIESITDAHFINQISVAATQRDAIFVWAAGNNSMSDSSALSAMPRVIPELQGHFVNVVAWDSNTGALAEYSNACGVTKDYCITAPGSNIANNETTRPVSGTSFATPIVSAAIAVLREAYPYMPATQITELLFTTARDLGNPGVDEIYGWGMLDMERATRPVGAALIPLGDSGMQQLATARVAAPIAHNIKSANIQFAYFDSFGRPFTTQLNNNIRATNPSRALEYLRDKNDIATNIGPMELGISHKDFLLGDGFLKLQQNTPSNFVGIRGNTHLGQINLFSNARITTTNADTTHESMISAISTIYTATAKLGAQYQDWQFALTIPDTIISGNMTLHMPTTRLRDGRISYTDTNINLTTRAPIEYSVRYKMLTAAFVDNPYGSDEFYIVAKGKINF